MTDYSEAVPVDVVPVTVADQDRVLALTEDVALAIVGLRAYPEAVEFDLLIRTRPRGETPNFAFDMSHLRQPGDFEIEALSVDAAGQTSAVPVHVNGGGGGDGRFEFRMWFELPVKSSTLALSWSWLERGLERTTTELDAARIWAAAGMVTRI